MYSNCSQCNSGSQRSACNNCACNGVSSSRCTREIRQYYISRYIDVPMNIYYGEGYTQQDSLRAIEESLSRIANTLCAICCKL